MLGEENPEPIYCRRQLELPKLLLERRKDLLCTCLLWGLTLTTKRPRGRLYTGESRPNIRRRRFGGGEGDRFACGRFAAAG